MGYTWRDHDIYIKRAKDLFEYIIRSTWREH